MLRTPAVAHQFYPGDGAALRKQLQTLIPPGPDNEARPAARALVSPHAGYIYSGAIAGETIGAVRIPATVVILGPNHHGIGSPAAVMARGAWLMPMGEVTIDEETATGLLASCPLLAEDESAHRREHSLEVQVPFLQYLRPDVRIVPVVLSHLCLDDCLDLGACIGKALAGSDTLLLASSDMTHYESRSAAGAKDRLAMERIVAMDPAGLYRTVLSQRISMCGIIPATIALAAALAMGAGRATLVRYGDSGEASGDTRQVVGYAGFVID
ncbi:MAG: AmmeMemoRadiSam system protein B [Thermodesulfobacteriota bacterium]